MQNFINEIFSFFSQIYSAIHSFLGTAGIRNMLTTPLLDGDLLSSPLTIQHIIMIVLPTITLFFFIYLIFKMFWNMVGLFTK